ncbi:MAG: RNA polymerase sigma factor [Gammaproteobacteria bacterium]|nr:RNA polymerase sigma factor [Gammaproteobacteria bacterium]
MEGNHNPFTDVAAGEGRDQELVQLAKGGSQAALEELVVRHQAWIYNLALRMAHHPEDAKDATQEVLIKLFTRLSAFDGRSSLRTWLYRIVINHLLNMKRSRTESRGLTFTQYGQTLDDMPDAELELPDLQAVPADEQLLIAEARIGCTSGMLLCLDRGQRLIFILGSIFGVSDVVGAELLELSRDNFRQKLARARRDLQNFMQDKCGLINTANPCRCAKKARGFITAGHIDPNNLRFARERVTHVRDVAARVSDEITGLDGAYAEVYRDHPFQNSPDFVAALRELVNRPEFRSTLELDQ